jgi:hypothetical protein
MVDDFKRSLTDGLSKVEQRIANNEETQKQIIDFCQKTANYFSNQPNNGAVPSQVEEINGLRGAIISLQ